MTAASFPQPNSQNKAHGDSNGPHTHGDMHRQTHDHSYQHTHTRGNYHNHDNGHDHDHNHTHKHERNGESENGYVHDHEHQFRNLNHTQPHDRSQHTHTHNHDHTHNNPHPPHHHHKNEDEKKHRSHKSTYEHALILNNDHSHGHSHDHSHDHSHSHSQNHSQNHSHSHDHDHDHDHGHKHEHEHDHKHSHGCSHDHSHDHDHDHDHGHHHGHHAGCTHSHTGWRQFAPHAHSIHTRLDADRRALLIALGILSTSLAAQLVGSAIASSSLLAVEAVHSAIDGVTVLVSLVATVISRWQPNTRLSYGYGRTEVLAALMSMSALCVLCFKLGISAIRRVIGAARGHIELETVNGRVVVFAESMTLAANILMAFVLRGKSSLNVRAVRAHVIADSVENVFVLTAGIVMWARPGWALIDPLLTIIVVCLLVWMNAGIAREVADVLMQAGPKGVSEQIEEDISRINGVARIDDLHVWTMTSGFVVGTVRLRAIETASHMDGIREIRHQATDVLRNAGVRGTCVEVVGFNEDNDGNGVEDKQPITSSPAASFGGDKELEALV